MRTKSLRENWALQLQPREGRPESSPGRQSWEKITTVASPEGTAETGENGFSRPCGTRYLSLNTTQDASPGKRSQPWLVPQAETGENGFSRPCGTRYLSLNTTQDCVLGYFQVAPRGAGVAKPSSHADFEGRPLQQQMNFSAAWYAPHRRLKELRFSVLSPAISLRRVRVNSPIGTGLRFLVRTMRTKSLRENWALQLQPREGRPESSPGR